MNPEVLTVREDMSVRALASFLVDNEITGAPVEDISGKLVGVVSLVDIASVASDSGGVASDQSNPDFFVRGWEDKIDLEEIRRSGQEALDAHVADVAATYDGGFPVDVVTRVVIGHTGTQILEAAEDTDAELVVLGSRGLGGFRGLMVGSVTTYAIHHLRTRLLVIPAHDHDLEER